MISTQLKLAIFRETLCQSLQDCLFIPTRNRPTPSQTSTVTGKYRFTNLPVSMRFSI